MHSLLHMRSRQQQGKHDRLCTCRLIYLPPDLALQDEKSRCKPQFRRSRALVEALRTRPCKMMGTESQHANGPGHRQQAAGSKKSFPAIPPKDCCSMTSPSPARAREPRPCGETVVETRMEEGDGGRGELMQVRYNLPEACATQMKCRSFQAESRDFLWPCELRSSLRAEMGQWEVALKHLHCPGSGLINHHITSRQVLQVTEHDSGTFSATATGERALPSFPRDEPGPTTVLASAERLRENDRIAPLRLEIACEIIIRPSHLRSDLHIQLG